MNNYLSQIENEFSRGRERASMLSPLDWNLAQSWEDSGIPLHIVLSTIADGFKKFQSSKHRETINSLRYFEQMVNKTYAEWKTLQVGKNTEEKTEMRDECFTAYADSENTDALEILVERLTGKTGLPEPLAATVAVIRGQLIQLINDADSKQLSTDDIENRLRQFAADLELPIIVSVPEAERAEMIAKINADYKDRLRLDKDSRAKILMRELYKRFGLPELTLFEF